MAAPQDEYYVFSYQSAAAAQLSNGRLRHLPLGRRSVSWQRAIEIPRYARSLALDVLHVPFNFLPAGSARKIVTIYDLAFLYYPEAHGALERARLKWLTGFCARRADHVLTASAFSRNDLVQRYRVPEQRITVAPAAVDRMVFGPPSEEQRAEFRRRSGVSGTFLLHVGTLQPRKNVGLLIDGLALLRGRGTDVQLVFVGRPERGAEELFRRVRAHGLEGVVHHVAALPDSALAGAYGEAAALVLTSLYEGFGLPALEAMSCGCPVVSSRAGALPEVCGEAALLFDPRNAEELVRHLDWLLTDAALRETVVRKGFANCERFSWERTAALVAGVYHAV